MQGLLYLLAGWTLGTLAGATYYAPTVQHRDQYGRPLQYWDPPAERPFHNQQPKTTGYLMNLAEPFMPFMWISLLTQGVSVIWRLFSYHTGVTLPDSAELDVERMFDAIHEWIMDEYHELKYKKNKKSKPGSTVHNEAAPAISLPSPRPAQQPQAAPALSPTADPEDVEGVYVQDEAPHGLSEPRLDEMNPHWSHGGVRGRRNF